MSPVGRLKLKRMPETLRRQIEVASASAWEDLVEVHASQALRFVALVSMRMPFDEAVSRYLAEMDVRDPMASSIRSRVLIALEDAQVEPEEQPGPGVFDRGGSDAEDDGDGLRRFRPDVLMKGIARKVRATEEAEQWVALSIARAEEAVLRVHIQNAVLFADLLHEETGLSEAVEDYIELLRITGGRAQAVFQRTMARLADLHLPEDGPAVAAGQNEARESDIAAE
ncbi:MAG: hypothetical protein KY466_11995 [Gemmatimonadetes bacterium]|nr:hypothetical protein [Gemmatimonadota bacterium]